MMHGQKNITLCSVCVYEIICHRLFYRSS